jgi:hypothetical protein
MTAPVARPANADAEVPVAWMLRCGVAACFIGHGALGLSRTAAWASYFAVVGIGREHALALMPWVGAFDVAMALSVLLFPLRGVILYMTVWALWTALLRPLAGEPFWEAVERAGNYGAPLALFLLTAGGSAMASLTAASFPPANDARRRTVCWILRITTALLLVGHGALGLLVRKPMFASQYSLIGLHWSCTEPLVGGIECALALAVLVKPARALLLGIVAWKLASEALCPLAGSPIWVFVEHGGSYAAPLALAFLQRSPIRAAADPSFAPQSKPQIPAFD